MSRAFHNPPGWPTAPDGWRPSAGWRPDPAWPPAPEGWVFWTETSLWPEPAPPGALPAEPHRSWLVRLGWLGTLAFGVATYVIVLRTMVETQNPNLFPTLLFIGAITVPCSILLLAYGLGHRVGQHGTLVAVAAVVGGVIGVISAGQLEYSTLRAMPGLGMVAVAVIEESVKMIVPLVIFLVVGRRTPGLGVVLGIASGAGFAVLETMGYGFTALLTSQGDLAAVDNTLMLRALLSPSNHVAWTGTVCAALWRFGEPARKGKVLVLLGAFAVAVALHATWDSSNSLIVHVAVAMASLGILIGTVVAGVIASRRARRNVVAPVVPPVA